MNSKHKVWHDGSSNLIRMYKQIIFFHFEDKIKNLKLSEGNQIELYSPNITPEHTDQQTKLSGNQGHR